MHQQSSRRSIQQFPARKIKISTYQEARHVEVVARHVHEDAAAVLEVGHRWRRGVAAGDVDGAHVTDGAAVDLAERAYTWQSGRQTETANMSKRRTNSGKSFLSWCRAAGSRTFSSSTHPTAF